MQKMKRIVFFSLAFTWMLVSMVWALDSPAWYDPARNTLARAMSEIGTPKADPRLLLLTNAGFGTIGDQSTEVFLGTVQKETGCSPASRSLLAVHTSVQEPLWCALYRKDTGRLVFFKWTGKAFGQQTIDASPDRILTPEGWQEAARGIIGPRIFSVVSISLTWAVEPPWPLLRAALFHDHFCPGVNSGFIAGQYLMKHLPLGSGEILSPYLSKGVLQLLHNPCVNAFVFFPCSLVNSTVKLRWDSQIESP
jgi:formylmethanofuran dehydrogenase subunit E-like metal-binding protein